MIIFIFLLILLAIIPAGITGGWQPSKVSSKIHKTYGIEPTKFLRIKHSGYINIENGRKTAEIRLDKTPFNEIIPGDIVAVYSACYPSRGIPIKVIAVGTLPLTDAVAQYGKLAQPDVDPMQYYTKIYNDADVYYITFKLLD